MKAKIIEKKIRKWSEFLEEAAICKAKVYPVGAQFVYDEGSLPSGMTGISAGDILNLQRENGMSSYDVPGSAEDWVRIDGNPGDGSGLDLTVEQTLTAAQKQAVAQNINDRPAQVDSETETVESMGYKVLNPNLSFAEQVESTQTVDNSNMIFEIKDEYDLGVTTEVTLSNTINIDGTAMYVSDEIALSANQVLCIENGIILNADKDSILSYKLVSSYSQSNYYIASTVPTIKYTIGGVVTLPANSTLRFNGGKVKNGTLVCNNTSIESTANGILDNIRLNGSLKQYSIPIEYWVVSALDGIDNSANIKLALYYSNAYRKVTFSNIYCVDEPIGLFNKIVEGLTIYHDKRGGIKANNGFKHVQTKSNTIIYDINAVLYHTSQALSELKNLAIDANKSAKYGLYNIPVSTTSVIMIDTLFVENALVAGILQYSVEKCVWEKVFVRYCRVGVVITLNLFNENNYFDFSGAKIGSPNMVTLKDCRFVLCNYGAIFFGIWNLSLENLETAYNSLYGIYISACNAVLLNDYYTEGDAIANVWIDEQGNRTYASRIPEGETEPVENRNRVHQAILNAGIDGLNISGNGLSDYARFRTVIYIGNSNVVFNAPSFSGHPRADKMQITSSSDIKLPTEREYAGIDGYVCAAGLSSLVINNYSVFDNTGNNWAADIFARIILNPLRLKMSVSLIGKSVDKIKIFGNIMPPGSPIYNPISINQSQKDYNNGRQLTYSSSKKDFSGIGVAEEYNGFPLYSMTTLGNTGYRITKTDMDSLFGTKMNQYMAVVLLKLTETLSSQAIGAVAVAAYSGGYITKIISASMDLNGINLKDAGYYFVQVPFWNSYPDRVVAQKKVSTTTTTISGTTYYLSGLEYIYSETEIQLSTQGAVLINSSKNTILSTDGYYKNILAANNTIVYIGHPVSDTTVEFVIKYKTSFDEIGLYFNSTLTNQSSKLLASPLYLYDVQDKDRNVPAPYTLNKGQTNKRPSLLNNQIGFKYFDCTIGKPIFWNGTAWVDSNGEAVGLQVSDTSVLIANSPKTVSVYYGGSTVPTITVLNSDDTANTWLTATPNPFTGNTLTLTAAANDTSAPRGAKVLVTLGDELVIINVIQTQTVSNE